MGDDQSDKGHVPLIVWESTQPDFKFNDSGRKKLSKCLNGATDPMRSVDAIEYRLRNAPRNIALDSQFPTTAAVRSETERQAEPLREFIAAFQAMATALDKLQEPEHWQAWAMLFALFPPPVNPPYGPDGTALADLWTQEFPELVRLARPYLDAIELQTPPGGPTRRGPPTDKLVKWITGIVCDEFKNANVPVTYSGDDEYKGTPAMRVLMVCCKLLAGPITAQAASKRIKTWRAEQE